MRNLKEYKAEIIDRSEKIIRERKRRARVLAVCIPLCLVLAAGVIFRFWEVPKVPQSGTAEESSEAHNTNIGMLKDLISVSVTYDGKTAVFEENDKMENLYKTINEFYSDFGEAENQLKDDLNNLYTENISFTICFKTSDGEEKFIFCGDKLYDENKDRITVLSEQEIGELKELLGISQ